MKNLTNSFDAFEELFLQYIHEDSIGLNRLQFYLFLKEGLELDVDEDEADNYFNSVFEENNLPISEHISFNVWFKFFSFDYDL